MSTVFHSALAARATDLQQSVPVLSQLSPQSWQGLAPVVPDGPGVEADIREFTPLFAARRQVAGRLGIKAPSMELLVPVNRPDRPHDFEVQPLLVVWPVSIPSVGGTSVLDAPVITAPPASRILLRVTWTIESGYRLSSSNPAIIASAEDLHLTNDYGGIDTPPQGTVTKTWHHLLGTISSTGEWVSAAFTSPFVPSAL